MKRRRLLAAAAPLLLPEIPVRAHAGNEPPPPQALRTPALRFAAQLDYGPFVFADAQGRTQGLSMDLLQAVSAQAHLAVDVLSPRPLATLLGDLAAGRVDLASSLRPTPERARYLDFSRPYVQMPAMLVARPGQPPRGLGDLAGRRVAVSARSAVESHVRSRHPAVHWVPLADDARGLQALVAGAVEALVIDTVSLAFNTRHMGLAPLQVIEPVGFEYELAFAARHGLGDVIDRIDAGLGQLPAEQRNALYQHWLGAQAAQVGLSPGGPALPLGLGLVGAAGLLALLGPWLRRRQPAGPADGDPGA